MKRPTDVKFDAVTLVTHFVMRLEKHNCSVSLGLLRSKKIGENDKTNQSHHGLDLNIICV